MVVGLLKDINVFTDGPETVSFERVTRGVSALATRVETGYRI